MTGSVISIIVMTASFAILAFVVAYLVSAAVSSDKIASDKRLDDLKKRQGDPDSLALVTNKSLKSRKKAEKKKQRKGGFFEKFGDSLYKELQSADIKMRPEEFITIWLLVSVLPASLVMMFLKNPVVAIILFVLGVAMPFLLIKNKQKTRYKQFDAQLSDALIIACSCLKSGLSFTQAMETIAKDMDAPISTEFSYALAEMGMGASMEDALEKMGDRIKSSYLQLMISAVLVQRQTGGNLSQILDTIAKTIKDRAKLKQELKSSTASGKMTGMMVGSMPFAMVLLFFSVNPEFIKPLFTESLGHTFIIVAIVLEVLAFIVIKKITTVKM